MKQSQKSDRKAVPPPTPGGGVASMGLDVFRRTSQGSLTQRQSDATVQEKEGKWSVACFEFMFACICLLVFATGLIMGPMALLAIFGIGISLVALRDAGMWTAMKLQLPIAYRKLEKDATCSSTTPDEMGIEEAAAILGEDQASVDAALWRTSQLKEKAALMYHGQKRTPSQHTRISPEWQEALHQQAEATVRFSQAMAAQAAVAAVAAEEAAAAEAEAKAKKAAAAAPASARPATRPPPAAALAAAPCGAKPGVAGGVNKPAAARPNPTCGAKAGAGAKASAGAKVGANAEAGAGGAATGAKPKAGAGAKAGSGPAGRGPPPRSLSQREY